MYSTEDRDLNFTVDNGDGSTPVDITGVTIFFKAARHPSATSVITKAGTITNGPLGKFKVSVTAADNASLDGLYYHESRIVDGSGNDTVVASGAYVVNKGLA